MKMNRKQRKSLARHLRKAFSGSIFHVTPGGGGWPFSIKKHDDRATKEDVWAVASDWFWDRGEIVKWGKPTKE